MFCAFPPLVSFIPADKYCYISLTQSIHARRQVRRSDFILYAFFLPFFYFRSQPRMLYAQQTRECASLPSPILSLIVLSSPSPYTPQHQRCIRTTSPLNINEFWPASD